MDIKRSWTFKQQPSAGAPFIAALLAVLALHAVPASAASPEFLWQVPEAGSDQNAAAAGAMEAPWAVAASPLSGDVFVTELENARISEFTSWGEFVRAWGWGVKDGSPELQTCTEETGCHRGIKGSGAGQLSQPFGVAVDQGGNVWVSEGGAENFRVQKFSPSGAFLLAIGGEVDKTTHGNLCTAASGDECGNGIAGTGASEFSTNFFHDNIDVDTGGRIDVGDAGRIEQFDASGSYQGQIILQGGMAGKSIEGLAVHGAETFYLMLKGLDDVTAVDGSGSQTNLLDTESPRGVAVDINGDVYVIDHIQTGFGFGFDEVVEFRPDGSCVICHGEEFATPDPIPNIVDTVRLNGIATNVLGSGLTSPGDVYVTAFSNIAVGNVSYVAAYGPLPRFELAPPKPPSIAGEAAVSVGSTTASLRAEVNPHFYASTTYYVEYGTEDCSLGGCSSIAARALGAERNAFAPTGLVSLIGLEPGTVYHYRFVATSGGFTTYGEEHVFTTYIPAGKQLPDGRAYEMVSPPAKNNGEVGNVVLTISPHQSTPGGEALTYTALAAFGDNPQSASGGSQYISRRTGSGWMTENISPPDQEGYIAPPVRAFSEDLAKAAMAVSQPPLVPEAPEGVENLYLRDNSNGAITLATDAMPTFPNGYCVNFSGASDDFSRIFFIARGALTSDAPKTEGNNLYEWSEAEGIRLVSVLPSGKPAPPSETSGFGSGGLGCTTGTKVLHNAISADGSRAYWSAGVSGPGLLVRLNGTETIQLDKVQGGSGPAGGGRFWGASKDGSVAFFTAPGKLTTGVGANALYRYDLEPEGGKPLAAITPGPEDANVLGVLGVSEDGSRVYFAATGALTAGAKVGEPNLYLWQEGEGLRLIGTLVNGDQADWTGEPGFQTARVTPDGSAVTFLSRASLTSFDNTDQNTGEPDPEVYLYDAANQTLSCVSCNSTGARPIGGAKLPSWSTPFQQPRYLSDGGQRMFFMTSDALDLHDTNSRQDVYEFERSGIGDCTAAQPTYSTVAGGCISLISTGTDPSAAVFIDASNSGNDVFFATPQRLVGQDVDENYDIYDARVAGGFPPPTPAPAPCSAESCRQPVNPPAAGEPGSSSYVGPGNVAPKKHHHKRKHHKKHKHRHRKTGRAVR